MPKSEKSQAHGNAGIERIRSSPQWKDGRFRNATPWEWMSLRDYAGMMADYMFRRADRTPGAVLPSVRADLALFSRKGSPHLSATWIGHSTLLLNVDGCRIVTDPILVKSMTLLGPWRYSGPVPVDIQAIPDIDVVLLSHNHFDHLNAVTVRRLAGRTKRFITALGVGADLRSCGVEAEAITELDWWEATTVGERLRITATPAQHFSGRRMNDRDRTLWASFVIEGPSHRVFFGGDSGYFDGFSTIGKRFGPFAMTFVETGAYSRYWHAVHMFPEETVQAHLDLGGELLHPIHWGTFNLSLHSWYEPMRRLVREARSRGVSVATPVAGQSTVYGSMTPTEEWWEDAVRRHT